MHLYRNHGAVALLSHLHGPQRKKKLQQKKERKTENTARAHKKININVPPPSKSVVKPSASSGTLLGKPLVVARGLVRGLLLWLWLFWFKTCYSVRLTSMLVLYIPEPFFDVFFSVSPKNMTHTEKHDAKRIFRSKKWRQISKIWRKRATIWRQNGVSDFRLKKWFAQKKKRWSGCPGMLPCMFLFLHIIN